LLDRLVRFFPDLFIIHFEIGHCFKGFDFPKNREPLYHQKFSLNNLLDHKRDHLLFKKETYENDDKQKVKYC